MKHIKLWCGDGSKRMLGPLEAEVIDERQRYPKVRILDEGWLQRLGVQRLEVNVHVFTQKKLPPDEAYVWYKLADDSWLRTMEAQSK